MRRDVFPSTYRNLQQHSVSYGGCCPIFLDVPGTFSNATHQVKAIAIGIIKDNPLVEIGNLL